MTQTASNANTASREQIDHFIQSGQYAAAQLMLASLWRQSASPATAGFVLSRFEKLRPDLPLVSCRLAVLRSFTVEPVIPLLRACAFVGGIDLNVQIGDFNSYSQEILNPQSSLYQNQPQAVILAVQTVDIAPDLWERFADLDAGAIEEAIKRVQGEFEALVKSFRARSAAHLIIHSLQHPPTPAYGVLDHK